MDVARLQMLVDPLAALGRIANREGEDKFTGDISRIGHNRLKQGDRQAGVVFLQGDQRIERLERDCSRKCLIGEINPGQRIFAGKGCGTEMRYGRQQIARRAKAIATKIRADHFSHIGRRQVAVQDAGIDDVSLFFDFDGEVGKAVQAALIGPVEDLPVDQAAGARQADRAGADAAKWERNFVQMVTLVNKPAHDQTSVFMRTRARS